MLNLKEGWFRTALVIIAILVTAGRAGADTKSDSWADLNFAFCEDIGVHATGRIEANATFNAEGGGLKVSSFSVVGLYSHPNSMTGSIEFTQPDGAKKKINLSKAWFSEIGPENTSSLYLPRNGNAAGAAGQTPFVMKAATSVEISTSTLFSIAGGNCPTSFSDSLTLP